jgi:hypothetical protein
MSDPRITEEAVEAATRSLAKTFVTNAPIAGSKDFRLDARAALEAALPHLAPQLTREQIEQRIRQLYIDGGAHIIHAQEAARDVADAVLDLINGGAK